MTDTMSARQRIGTIVHAARDVLFIDEATDYIIDIVREALLDPDVLHALTATVADANDSHGGCYVCTLDGIRTGMPQALDAAFGEPS